jgi:hypothetical protein
MLIGSGLQALDTSGKFKPGDFGQIRTAGDSSRPTRQSIALSPRRAAKLRMTWSQSPEGQLAICWREFGGPLVVPPTRNGFSSRVIKTLIEQTGGTIAFDWREDGLCCKLTIPKPEG